LPGRNMIMPQIAPDKALQPRAAIGNVAIRNARRYFGSVRALDGVSLDVKAGEFVALLGPSGSGKTTLLMTVAGFEIPDAGTIHVDGIDITEREPSQRNLGMVFQRYALFPHLSVGDNIAFPLRMRGVALEERKRRVEAALETVGLAGYATRLPSQLSGGQQQRVALARAIVFEPPVLLMDEPLSALDKNLRERMRLEIKRLQQQLGITVLFVTHDQEEALVMADRIAVMDHGRLIQEGTPRELYTDPKNAFVAAFLGETNFLSGTVVETQEQSTLFRVDNGAIVHGRLVQPSSGRARLSVRPEHIVISDVPIGAAALKATLRDVIFAGPSLIVLADIEGSEPLNIRVSARDSLAGKGPGDEVFLSWRASDAPIFPA
jgi:spermidine/putrescine ABC transporter ATP-binding subunit